MSHEGVTTLCVSTTSRARSCWGVEAALPYKSYHRGGRRPKDQQHRENVSNLYCLVKRNYPLALPARLSHTIKEKKKNKG